MGYALAEREFSEKVFTANKFKKIENEQGVDAAIRYYEEGISAGKIFVKDVIADAFLQNTLLKPEEYSVIATLNLNGDYISDQMAAMVGGIGIAPGANINYLTGHAIFEATHGTAPDIAGKNLANPSSMLLSGAMMLEYLGWDEAGRLITKSMEYLFSNGFATFDLSKFMKNGTVLSTSEFSEKIIENL
jgi:isocitrate dehydrogenase